MAADPVVSPADTLAMIHRAINALPFVYASEREAAHQSADALLAVGERDKAERERLAGIEAAARALVDAEDADEDAVDRLIAEDDTDGSLSEAQAQTRANADAASDALRAVLAGGESPGERDRQQIARLTEDFNDLRLWVAQHLGAIDLEDVDGDVAQVLSSLDFIVRGNAGCTEEADYTPEQWRVLQLCAVLAGEEDAQPSSEPGSAPESRSGSKGSRPTDSGSDSPRAAGEGDT